MRGVHHRRFHLERPHADSGAFRWRKPPWLVWRVVKWVRTNPGNTTIANFRQCVMILRTARSGPKEFPLQYLRSLYSPCQEAEPARTILGRGNKYRGRGNSWTRLSPSTSVSSGAPPGPTRPLTACSDLIRGPACLHHGRQGAKGSQQGPFQLQQSAENAARAAAATGIIKIEMAFPPTCTCPCEVCGGSAITGTLDVAAGKSISTRWI